MLIFFFYNFGKMIASNRNAYILKEDYANGRKTANDDSQVEVFLSKEINEATPFSILVIFVCLDKTILDASHF